MKEFTVCYTFDDNIITEKIIKNSNVKKEDVEKEIFEKMDRDKYFMIKNDQGVFMVNTFLVRYVRIMYEKVMV
ncbi:hypothetical protein [Neobacillus cucumis]|uniref:Uncharacterized protein n=1 Tax=Neobacillus cucumis TaxID=1740721 RepID=A0A2N5HSJ1_9BACI|nr:hypothetical protein [Neobacillus cucumis]PLS08482.1 hypothetical protein CVD27_03520 [Neobacillus cucumis]